MHRLISISWMNEMLQATRCCKRRDVASDEMLQATRCCKRRDVASDEMLQICKQRDNYYTFCFDVLLTKQVFFDVLLTKYVVQILYIQIFFQVRSTWYHKKKFFFHVQSTLTIASDQRITQTFHRERFKMTPIATNVKVVFIRRFRICRCNDKFEATRNNFDFKLQIYINKCRRADISSHVYDKKTNIMLKKKSIDSLLRK
jgi:hypothetical protein